MSSLATLGTALQKSTGLPALAASAPGDASLNSVPVVPTPSATPAAPAPATQSKIAYNPLGAAFGQTANTVNTLPLATNKAPATPGSAASVVHATTNAAGNADSNNTGLQNVLAQGSVATAQAQVAQGSKDTTQGAADTATYTQQQAQAVSDLNNMGGNWTTAQVVTNNVALQAGKSTYTTASNQPPAVIFDENTFNRQDGYDITGTVYVLQSNGTYQPVTFQNNQQFQQIMAGKNNNWVTVNKAVGNAGFTSVVNGFEKLAQASAGLANAQALTAKGQQETTAGNAALTGAQNQLQGVQNTIASNATTATLGAALAGTTNAYNSAYGTDLTAAQGQQSAAMQKIGNAGIGASGSALDASAFGSADTAQSSQQALNVQGAGLVDQQAEQVGTALQNAITSAQGQSGLQLQTMKQNLSAAITELQNDLQYATGQQAQNIQAYINSLTNAQNQLSQSIGAGNLTAQEITQAGTAAASGVAAAGAAYVQATNKTNATASTGAS